MIIGGVQETESTLESLRENKLNKIEKSEINLSDHLGTYIELLIKNAEGKKIKIDNQISKDIKVKAGNNELKIILHNLISNAIKFTNNGIISLRSEKDGDFVKIYVADNGVGISKEKLAKFSSENFVESTEGTNNETGTGTGIRAVYKSVEEMGGSISVESEEGKGTTFIVTLPAGENSVENK
jgi:signal transduction histidine kinase